MIAADIALHAWPALLIISRRWCGANSMPILCQFLHGGRIWKAESECYTTAESKAGQASASRGETA